MTYQVFCQHFAPGSWSWIGKDPAGVGMQLDGAFRAFAATVNAHPANASIPLSVIRSHADATENRWGYTWQLGHPSEPGHVWFRSTSLTAQGESQSNSSVEFGRARASGFSDTTSNGGYGSYTSSTSRSAGLAYLDTTTGAYSTIGAILLIVQDTTAGAEFFCWALKTYGGNEELHRDCCHLLFRCRGSSGWTSLVVFPDTSSQRYSSVALEGYAGESFVGLIYAVAQSAPSGMQQLRSRIAIGVHDFNLDPQDPSPSPPLRLPPPLFIGSTRRLGPTVHFGRVTFPDGVMLQLGQSSLSDIWLWVPSGSGHHQSSPWFCPLLLEQWIERDKLHFVEGPAAAGDLQTLPGSADFRRHFPAMSAVGVRQHPYQASLLAGSTEGGDGAAGSGEGRPSAGLLWPRRC